MKFFPKFEKSRSLLGIKIKDLEEFFKIFHTNNLKQFRLKSGEFSITLEKFDKDKIENSRYVYKEFKNEANETKETNKNLDEDKTNKILAPITGTFYTSPAPGQPPFVEVGDEIDENTIVCIIESMKVMNEIKSNKKGKIKKRLIENGQKVKKGDPIFEIE